MSSQLKIERVKSIFNCQLCHKLLANPITLPCGYTICRNHLDELTPQSCTFCHLDHSSQKFAVNIVLKELLEMDLNKLKLSDKFDACKKSMDETMDLMNSIEAIQNDRDNYIFEYFQELKRQVDQRREELKLEIDTCSENIITKINETQSKCSQLTNDVIDISKRVNAAKLKLNHLMQKLDSFEIDDEKYNGIQMQLDIVRPKLASILEEYKSAIIGDNYYEFVCSNICIDDIFGQFISVEGNYKANGSTILDESCLDSLVRLCGLKKRWTLIYRASEHGFSSQSFHSKCDGIPSTITIVKSTNNNIFGGYTKSAWTSENQYNRDADAFIFSLVNKEGRPFKANCSNGGDHAVFCNASHGPTFGEHDIYISSNSNQNRSSHSNIGYSYKHSSFVYGSSQAKCMLAGSYNFETVEVEVYHLEC